MAAVAIYAVHYNFYRIHQTLRVTPAMAAGVDTTPRSIEWLVSLLPFARHAGGRPRKVVE